MTRNVIMHAINCHPLPSHTRHPSLRHFTLILAVALVLVLLPPYVSAQPETSQAPVIPSWHGLLSASLEHLGALIIAIVAGAVAYVELRAHRRAQERLADVEQRRFEKTIELEDRRFNAEQAEREKLATFREEEYRRFAQPAPELAAHIAGFLVQHPEWARRALDAAKLLPYTETLFGERSEHFQIEKQFLAEHFTPYLLQRCEALTSGDRHVFLLVDAGTTLYAFFEILGKETMRRSQRGEDWLRRFHLATNNLPGIEQLIKTGRRAPLDRYSGLAIEDCHLLPGVPVPIFAAVAGEETNDAIRRLKERYVTTTSRQVTFVALVVGNWIRIRRKEPHCPVPMARGREHWEVKQTLVSVADEIFVVSPLGKIFVGQAKDDVNAALGFKADAPDPDRAPYEDVDIDDATALRTKLVSTTRAEARLLHRHSNRVEDALIPLASPLASTSMVGTRRPGVDEHDFATAQIQDVPHLLFPFGSVPASRFEEFLVEFPHAHTRRSRRLLEMFGVDPAGV